jgi:hypothetical protein
VLFICQKARFGGEARDLLQKALRQLVQTELHLNSGWCDVVEDRLDYRSERRGGEEGMNHNTASLTVHDKQARGGGW